MSSELLLAAVSAAQGFDVDVATRAYLDTVQGAARAKSDAYFEGGYWLPLWGTLITVLVYGAMLRFGWTARWSSWAARIAKGPVRQAALYAIPFTLVGALLTLPWTIYTDFIREKQYGLVNQGFGAWFGEYAISLGLSLLATMLFFMVLFTVIRRAPKSWWVWGTGATVALLAFLVLISPVFVAPLFNKYQPMAEGQLRDEILAMARAEGIPADNVYVFDASKQTKRISANVSGLGPTIRISLNDNLLNRSSPAGIKSVMGHEMGHYRLHHVWWLLAIASVLAVAGFLILYWLVPKILLRHGQRWGIRDVSDPAVVPLLGLVMALAGLPSGLLLNTVVRNFESQADYFGLEAAREPDGFAMTAMQLSEYRKIEPSGWEEILFYDHPSGRSRVRMSMEWKAKHLAELPPDQRRVIVMKPPAD